MANLIAPPLLESRYLSYTDIIKPEVATKPQTEEAEALTNICYKEHFLLWHNVATKCSSGVEYRLTKVVVHKPQGLPPLEDKSKCHQDVIGYVGGSCPWHIEHESVQVCSELLVKVPRSPNQRVMSAEEPFDRTCPLF